MPVHLHDAGESLHQRIVARQIAPNRPGTESAQRIIKNVRVLSADGRFAYANPLGNAGAHAL